MKKNILLMKGGKKELSYEPKHLGLYYTSKNREFVWKQTCYQGTIIASLSSYNKIYLPLWFYGKS